MEKEVKKSNKWQAAMLLLMLVILPGGSWLFMKYGYEESQKAVHELKIYGDLPAFYLIDAENNPLDSSAVNGQMTLVGFLNPQDHDFDSKMKTLKLIHKQFDERNDFKLLMHFPNSADISKIKASYNLEDSEQLYFVKGEEQVLEELKNHHYKVPIFQSNYQSGDELSFLDGKSSSNNTYPYFILVDENAKIRNYYRTNVAADMDKMVSHIALILPRNLEGDPRLRRNREL